MHFNVSGVLVHGSSIFADFVFLNFQLLAIECTVRMYPLMSKFSWAELPRVAADVQNCEH